MTNPIARIYDETRGWGRGPLDPQERGASRADAVMLLAMCGLLRKGGK